MINDVFIFCLAFDYNARCKMTRECDERKYLRCSRKTCLCYDSYYPFNQACFPSKLKKLISDLASMHLLPKH